MKIVINKCYGGFGLSHKGTMRYAKIKGIVLYPFTEVRDKNNKICSNKYEPYSEDKKAFFIHYSTKPLKQNGEYEEDSYFTDSDISRDDVALIQLINEMDEKASGRSAELEIIEVPNDVEWEIEEYDGIEWVAEKHRTWD